MEITQKITQTFSEAETEAAGEALAARLKPRDTVALFGGLGAGKTAFTRGLARGLGVRVPVVSPTYTIINEYDAAAAGKLLHCDMYRIKSSDELFEIGFYDLAERGVVVIEWSENIPEAIPADAVIVSIKRDPDNDGHREITITEQGTERSI